MKRTEILIKSELIQSSIKYLHNIINKKTKAIANIVVITMSVYTKISFEDGSSITETGSEELNFRFNLKVSDSYIHTPSSCLP